MEQKLKGQITSINADLYEIEHKNQKYILKAAGKLKLSNKKPIVGDFVIFDPNKFFTKILKRKNYLERPKAANIDQAIIITSLVEPNYSSILLNKTLAIIENKNIKPILIFTKKDKCKKEIAKEYEKQGYTSFEISNKTKENIEKLKNLFKNKLSVFIGQSGAGKTSTINSIAKTKYKTDKISKSLGRGKHTTRIVKIINWMDGKLIDTPGFSSLNLNLTELELSRAWHDFKIYSLKCQFSRNCIHFKEENCEVKNMVQKGKISNTRYNDYIRLIKEIQNERNSSVNIRNKK